MFYFDTDTLAKLFTVYARILYEHPDYSLDHENSYEVFEAAVREVFGQGVLDEIRVKR